jgi:hypothetical protein
MQHLAPSYPELLTAWRDAARAADLAERLSLVASDAADRADAGTVGSREIIAIAERVARASTHTAAAAHRVAKEAARFSARHETRTL